MGRPERLMACAVLLAVALAIVAPFVWLGTASGHDFNFHASSWLDVAWSWKQGTFYPRWNEWANNGFGEPRFLFYPPLSWMLGGALGFLLPWRAVAAAFIFVVQFLAGWSALALARRLLPPGHALFAAAIYAVNPYALLVLYLRSDYAELLACAFLPLLVLAALQIVGWIPASRGPCHGIASFAVWFAAVWLSNAPAGVVASYAMALLFAVAALAEHKRGPLLRGAAGLALGLGLAGFYLVPAAYEQRWVDIAQALSAGLLPRENFVFTFTPDTDHNFFNVIASGAAVLMLMLTAGGALGSRRFAKPNVAGRDKEARAWRMLLLLAAVSGLLMLRLSAPLWQWLPKLRFVQFPWRWLIVLAVPLALFLAEAVRRQRRAWPGMLAVAAILAATGAFFASQAWWDSEDMPALQAGIASDHGYEGTDEYDPAGDDRYNLPPSARRVAFLDSNGEEISVPAARVDIQVWRSEFRKLRVNSPKPVRLALRLLNYPAWRVTVNGKVVRPQRRDDYNEMVVPLEAGTSEVVIRFARTRDRTAGDALSLVSLLCLAGVAWKSPKRTV
jgi:hypothetical protein